MGRVFAALLAFTQAGIRFGATIAGVAIEKVGLIPTIAAGAVVYITVLTLMFFNPALRRMDMSGGTRGQP
jgi:predicted MFS family arabinose efflux permease